MDEEMRETGENEEEGIGSADFSYMKDLLKAYNELFAERKFKENLSEEKRDYVASAQRKIRAMCESVATRAPLSESKELAFMAKESATQCLAAIGAEEEAEGEERASDYSRAPLSTLLPRSVLLANRALNTLVRSGVSGRPALLILSELSALYAIAAIR